MPEQSSSFSPTAVEMGSTVDEPETHDLALDVGGAVARRRVAAVVGVVAGGVVVVTARRGDEAEGEQQGQPGEPLLLEQGMPSLGEQQVSYR